MSEGPGAPPAGLVARLRAAGCVFAEEEAALLVAAVGDPLEELVARRVTGEPLEHVLGWASFHGLRVAVAPGVFVPRRRTELLVRLALSIVRYETQVREPPEPAFRIGLSNSPTLVDLCCGSGAVGAAVAHERPDVTVWAGDVDPVAVACARRNLPTGRVHEGDLYDALPAALRRSVDVVVANAPYVPTGAVATMPAEARDHEPRGALDGGNDGVELHRRVARDAPAWLRPGGVLLLETSRRQAPLTRAACEAAGLEARVETDDDLDATAVVARLTR